MREGLYSIGQLAGCRRLKSVPWRRHVTAITHQADFTPFSSAEELRLRTGFSRQSIAKMLIEGPHIK
jgi:hypothetical protein